MFSSKVSIKTGLLGMKSVSSVFFSRLILHFITVISLSLELLTKRPDQGSVCREKKPWLPTCVAQRNSWQTHKSLDTWSRKEAWASPLEPVTSLSMLPECLGLQPNLGCMEGSEMDSQKGHPARELAHLYSGLAWNLKVNQQNIF